MYSALRGKSTFPQTWEALPGEASCASDAAADDADGNDDMINVL